MEKPLLDTKNSTLTLEGTTKDQAKWSKKIDKVKDALKPDRAERATMYQKRRDFYQGNQGEYSNVVGIIKDTKQKKGHTNQVTNYAGKTVVKMAMGLANNPPKLTTPPLDINDALEVVRAQAVEDYTDSILDSKRNKFWKKTYRRSAFIQGELGDAAIKTYLDGDEIVICGHDNMETIMVAWNGDPDNYDSVVVENLITPDLVEELYGIKVNEATLKKLAVSSDNQGKGSWDNNTWATGSSNRPGASDLPSGKNKLSKVRVTEYDSKDVYAIKIEDELVQLIFKDDIKYPKINFWTIVHNIPNPPSPWSIADIDYLFDPQIELNENDNRSSDHLRVGNVQRYVAYNLSDFDPESIKTSSGQVIFVDDPDGKSRFEPLPTNINNFPDDQFNSRKLAQIFDMGLPKVNYGASGADSGRSKAIDYQSSVDLTSFKRDAWELALQDICEKIQILGNFLIGEKVDWFQDSQGNFVTRNVEFDWNDVLPISQSDKIVNIANKFNMIGLSLEQAYKELGYRNPKAMITQLKNELQDPDLMILRSKAWQLSQGLLEANNNAAAMAQSNNSQVPPPAGNSPAPMLTSSQNQPNSQPMASSVGNTAVSSANGVLAQAQQNTQASGG